MNHASFDKVSSYTGLANPAHGFPCALKHQLKEKKCRNTMFINKHITHEKGSQHSPSLIFNLDAHSSMIV